MYLLRNDGASRQPIFGKKDKSAIFFFRLMSGSVAVDRVWINIDETASNPLNMYFFIMVPSREKIRKQNSRNVDMMKRLCKD